MLRKVPQVLQDVYGRRLRASTVRVGDWPAYLRWLQFYLNFCDKYRHPPRDPDSLQPFLQKLAAKNQTLAEQQQAAASVGFYYEVMKEWPADAPQTLHSGAPNAPWENCLKQLKDEVRLRQYSPKTYKCYAGWIGQFQAFLDNRDPSTLTSEEARAFLTHLAVDRRVVATTQNQAFNALLFLYRHILKAPYELGDSVVRARRKQFVPVVLSREEVDAVLARLQHPARLAVSLLYGCGLRMAECLNLRVQCFNFDQGVLTIHDAKGRRGRTVPIPVVLRSELRAQIARVSCLHEKDVADGYDGVFMPGAMDRKSKSAAKQFIWQWFFPAEGLTFVPETQERRRYHLHETQLQKALHAAVAEARIPKRVTCHTFRHTFASHLLRANYDIRTIQLLLGHSDIRTTMIYTHTVPSRTLKETSSPLDFPPESLVAPPPHAGTPA